MTAKIDSNGSHPGEEWLSEQLVHIIGYFLNEGIDPPTDLEVEFSLPPVLAIWGEASPDNRKRLWVISGDCPIDYIVSDLPLTPRQVLMQFARQWQELADTMKSDLPNLPERTDNGDDALSQSDLGDLLQQRAALLESWSQKDDFWP